MNDDETRRHRYLYAAIALAALLLAFGIYRRCRAEVLLRRVRDLQQALRDAPPEQRGEKWQQLRQTMDSMSPRQREQLMADGRKRFEESMVSYTRLSDAEKTRYLDEQIDRAERFRQNAPANRNFGAGQPRPARSSSPEERERRRKQRLDQSSPEFRAAMDQFRKDMEARRRQRDLPPRR